MCSHVISICTFTLRELLQVIDGLLEFHLEEMTRMSLDVHWCSKRIKVHMVAIFERFCYASKSYELYCASYPLSFVATCV
ncbi:hypothetical protein BDA96_07G115300 [Sorghum bicolor]|uniref:Uncharacterized protein n=2 Tax=Sorghum bicolor TaxID=4558 RepID=A0A1Z5RA61_SORBI|nr:hypothetical protein BDA96_07G115300 [Sorghum bicolor]OQU80313.1 hypothetical protein SORBI_3007G109301 [Sorghum bicolor]OQU80314.1 hypothetical protein SORBI_3007G109301 [Sorghum bicolor]OQU80315.1 hypothetical protein SORBI_3007G109301 [Sorghum bicolor]OQU80316.1 hypothetical protein SORBI_3007G109301 [Sorghum bicolor]